MNTLASTSLLPSSGHPLEDSTPIGTGSPSATLRWLMVPAVRLFGARSFGGRAFIISLLFLLPLLGLSLQIAWQWQQTAQRSQRELSGLRYVADGYRVLQASQAVLQRSLGQAPLNAERATLRQALDALAATQDSLGTDEAYQQLQESLRKAEASGTGFASFLAYDRVGKALLRLIEAAADHSGLAVDADLVTHDLVSTLTRTLPQLSERSAQTATASAAALRAKAMTPLLQRVLNDNEVMIDFQFTELKSKLAKLGGADPALVTALQTDQAVKQSGALFAEVERAVSDATDLTADAASFEALANQALRSQHELAQHTGEGITQRLEQRIAAQQQAGWALALGMGLQLLLVAYAFYGFYLVTNGGLLKTAAHLRSVMRGDLASPFQPLGADQAAELTGSLQDMQQSLRTMVQAVRESAQQIVHGSHEIASAATDLSERSAETSHRIAASAGMVQQIAGTLQETADNASQAATVAARNAQAAQRGGGVVDEVVQTMRDIESSSKRIANIIGLIDGIAFQTNILALNAAVEAARAGNQGRGFAVVATEVRSLAHRVTEAALEVKGLIATSLQRVQAGTEVAQGAGRVMQEIMGNAQQLDQVLARIAQASQQETRAVTDLNQTVSALSSGTQHDLQRVEQTAAAASGLRQQSDHLITLVERFRLH